MILWNRQDYITWLVLQIDGTRYQIEHLINPRLKSGVDELFKIFENIPEDYIGYTSLFDRYSHLLENIWLPVSSRFTSGSTLPVLTP